MEHAYGITQTWSMALQKFDVEAGRKPMESQMFWKSASLRLVCIYIYIYLLFMNTHIYMFTRNTLGSSPFILPRNLVSVEVAEVSVEPHK